MTLQRGMATKLVDVIYVAMEIPTLNGIFYNLNQCGVGAMRLK